MTWFLYDTGLFFTLISEERVFLDFCRLNFSLATDAGEVISDFDSGREQFRVDDVGANDGAASANVTFKMENKRVFGKEDHG